MDQCSDRKIKYSRSQTSLFSLLLFYFINNNIIIVHVRYITIETKEVVHIGYNRFLFPYSYLGEGLSAMHLSLSLSTYSENKTRYIKYGKLLLFQ